MMTTSSELPPAPLPIAEEPLWSTPLKEVRALKRWVQIGVYGAILGTEPVYYFVLHYSVPQLVIGLAIGMTIAYSAIEWAFGQMFKLRKRSAYPGVLFQEMGGLPGLSAATEHAQFVIMRLLGLRASFIALFDGSDNFALVDSSGLDVEDANVILAWAPDALRDGSDTDNPVVCISAHSAPQADSLGAHERLCFVPIVALQETIGVLGVIGDRRNRDLWDTQLLAAIGVALGLSLDNLRQNERLRESEDRLRTLVTSAPIILSAIDTDGKFRMVTGKGLDGLNVRPEQVVGQSVYSFTGDTPEAQEAFQKALAGEEVIASGEIGEVSLESRLSPIRSRSGDVTGVISVAWDITEQRRAEEARRKSEERTRIMYESSRDVIYTVDASGTITSLNPAFETITGWSCNEWIGKNFAPLVHPEDLPEVAERFQTLLRGEQLESQTQEWRVRSKSGDYLIGEFVPVPLIEDGKVVGAIGFVRDITERRKAEETIRHLAYHDPLTELPNRVLFSDRLNVALANAKRHRQMLAVMFLDLDRFKIVNDMLGHAGGDELLRDVARQLSEVVRDGDTVARVGGDEFMFLVTDISRAEDAIAVAERILACLVRPRPLAGQEFRLSTSIGITVFPRDGVTAADLMRNADTAMYKAKERGRDNYQFYTSAMEASLLERLALENDLRHALEREELLIHYQPVLETVSGRVVGSEALLRWQHPERGLVSPEDFIPLAEETGLIPAIGAWTLRSACLQNKAWQEAGLEPIKITVNISARQLEQGTLVETVTRILNETGLPARYLHLEVTEGAVMKNVESIINMLTELKQMGIGISVDDFGTGYSSLSYLKRFPIDTIKIDRSFIRDIAQDANDAAIVTTVIAMARSLNLKVVAEGVETEEQLEFLREHGCDEYQGYLASKPLAPRQFAKLLSEATRPRARILPLKLA